MTVTKKVRFYTPMSGDAPWPGTFPAQDVLQKFDELWTDISNDAALLPLSGSRDLAAQHLPDVGRLRNAVLYMFRRDDWPMVHNVATGQISPIALGDDQEIAEPTYFGFGPRNVLALLYNHAGPKVQHLERYLAHFCDLDVTFAPIVHPDVMRTINEAAEIRSLGVQIPRARVDVLPNDDPITREMRVLANRSRAHMLDLRWSIDARSGDWADRDSFTAWAKGLVQTFGRHLDAFKKVEVRVAPHDAPDNPALDLLHETITMTEHVE
ncbi:MAG: Oxidoreductase, partial [Actinomycetia bacterium]|nr:Oxidoreductase [Actinomycetes bacterium]